MRTAALSGLLVLGLLALVGGAVAESSKASAEIAYLLHAVDHSNCSFLRNGSWHDSHAAADHLRAKYELKSAAGLIESAEEFVAKVASKSSFSGERYEVRCSDGRQVPSTDWLLELLRGYREQQLSHDTAHHT